MLDQLILNRAKDWASNPCFDQQTRDEIQTLLSHGKEVELNDRFYRDLEFGTGGLRGILGAGTARMNFYNIRKATTAFARYLRKVHGDKPLKVGITYDSRKFSKEFAEATASTFAAHQITALLTKNLRPVPMLSFMVRSYECAGGVCITASHNPPNYNGYKVYWNNGGQVVPPHDSAIIEEYGRIQRYDDLASMDFQQAVTAGLVQYVGEELDRAYFKELQQLRFQSRSWPDFRICFTPLHGTAGGPVTQALNQFGFSKIDVVPEQAQPDGNFPTVKSPNPEDPDALDLAVKLATKNHADLVLGTDPDCDRVGIVYRRDESFHFLNGNQIGCLLTEYVLSQMRASNRMPSNPLVVKTIVTTDLQAEIAKFYGCHVDETLTGFKWICHLIEQYENGTRKPQRTFVCGGEESYGFLAGNFVRDKDGIAACVIAAEMTAYYLSKGLTLDKVLDQIFRRHGVYHETLSTMTLPGKTGAEQIKAMMQHLRELPPKEICGTLVERVSDIQAGFSYHPNDPKQRQMIDLPKSDVLQLQLSDLSRISIRPSGTEPKIKFYVSARTAIDPDCTERELDLAKVRCQQRAQDIEKAFFAMATNHS